MKNFVFISPHFPSSYWKFVRALKLKGFNVLGIGDALYNDIPFECKEYLTEYYCCPNMEIYENEKKALEYFIKKYGPIDYLESNNEFWLEKDARLRTDFNIVNGADNEEVKKFKFKSIQKAYFKKAGAKVSRFCLPKSIEDVINFVNEVNYPIFFKPDNGVGAQGTKKINNEKELKEFFPQIINQNYICEEFVDGSIISFDGICDSNSNVVFCTQNIFLVDNATIVENELDDGYYCLPTLDKNFEKLGRDIIKAFELKKRFFHLEFFKLLSDHPYLGKKGDIIPLEANMRPAGGYTPDLINFANSLSCYDIYADIMMDDVSNYDNSLKKYVAITSSRRKTKKYLHSFEEIKDKYLKNICMYGEYPKAISDDMGDYYYFAKFDTLNEALEFDEFVRKGI